jgi:hypothetical protein
LIDLTTEGLALWKSKFRSQGCDRCRAWIIGLARELSLKAPNCVKTDLTAAFSAPSGHLLKDRIAETSANQ